MAFLLLIGLALVGVAFAVAGRALVMSRRRMVASVSGIERYGFASTGAVDDGESRSSLQDLASFVGETVGGRLGARPRVGAPAAPRLGGDVLALAADAVRLPGARRGRRAARSGSGCRSPAARSSSSS